MEKIHEYLNALASTASDELRLEPNKNPCLLAASNRSDICNIAIKGPEISSMVFPLIPPDVRRELPGTPEVEFIHPHNLGKFTFRIRKSPAGFIVSVKPCGTLKTTPADAPSAAKPIPELATFRSAGDPQNFSSAYATETISFNCDEQSAKPGETFVPAAGAFENEVPRNADPTRFSFALENVLDSAKEYVTEGGADVSPQEIIASPLVERRGGDRRHENILALDRVESLLRSMAEIEATDLHLSIGSPPMIRLEGRMQALPCDETALSADEVRELLVSLMPAANQETFRQGGSTEFTYELRNTGRFRCSVFTDIKGAGGVLRMMNSGFRDAEQLGLSPIIQELCGIADGMIIVAGSRGSGRSTTLCAMIDKINKTRADHVITIEDAIEFIHENVLSHISQREVRGHAGSLCDAVKNALHEDPNVLMIGDLRDLETISLVMDAADTGHLVLGTMHTTTVQNTLTRLIDQFPPDRRQQIRTLLSESLRAVVVQTLVSRKAGGRVAAMEVLTVTPEIAAILREGDMSKIPEAITAGAADGMCSLNDSLLELVSEGAVDPRDAFARSLDKPLFEAMLAGSGISNF